MYFLRWASSSCSKYFNTHDYTIPLLASCLILWKLFTRVLNFKTHTKIVNWKFVNHTNYNSGVFLNYISNFNLNLTENTLNRLILCTKIIIVYSDVRVILKHFDTLCWQSAPPVQTDALFSGGKAWRLPFTPIQRRCRRKSRDITLLQLWIFMSYYNVNFTCTFTCVWAKRSVCESCRIWYSHILVYWAWNG